MNNILRSFCGAIVALTVILSASVITHAEPVVTESKDPVYDRVDLTRAEKKAITEMFDAEYYAKTNPDVVEAYGNSKTALLTHFLQYGLWESRQPNDDFNVNAYASAYKDLQKAFGSEAPGRQIVDLYTHYNKYGKEEGRATTTIEKCLESDITVRYHGAVDNPVTKGEEARIVAAPAPKKVEAPAPQGITVSFIITGDVDGHVTFTYRGQTGLTSVTIHNVTPGSIVEDIRPDVVETDPSCCHFDSFNNEQLSSYFVSGSGNVPRYTEITESVTLYTCMICEPPQ